MTPSRINISGTYDELCLNITQAILDLSNAKIALNGRFNFVLSGGSTPKGVYACMASSRYKDRFDWKKMHLFWSDERCVPHHDPKSNFRMVEEALLTKINIPSENIHPIPIKGNDYIGSGRSYEETLKAIFQLKEGEWPPFDLVLLGLGADGHIASLFPENESIAVHDRLAMATSQKGIAEERITLSLPAINHASHIFFLVSGPQKARIVAQVLENDEVVLPAQRIRPVQGDVSWFLDQAAGELLNVDFKPAPKRIGIAADHGGFLLKEQLIQKLRSASYEVTDFGDHQLSPEDDYPDYIIPLARAVASKQVDRGIGICSSGVGACIAANKVAGVRACMVHEKFSARQGVEDDDMNVICLGAKVLNIALASELVEIFLSSRFSNAQRHRRRLAKVAALEGGSVNMPSPSGKDR